MSPNSREFLSVPAQATRQGTIDTLCFSFDRTGLQISFDYCAPSWDTGGLARRICGIVGNNQV